MTSPAPSISGRGPFGLLTLGLSLVPRAFALLFKSKKLLGLAALCAAVTALVLVGSAAFLWPRTLLWAQHLVGGPDTWRGVAAAVLHLLLFVVTFALAALTLPNVILAPLLDPISEATEALVAGVEPPPFRPSLLLTGAWYALRHTALRFTLTVVGFAVLWPLHFLPVIGSVTWAIVGFAWSSFLLALEHTSGPYARHLRPSREALRALTSRPTLALGFGAPLSVLLWVPIVNFFLMPVAVIAGTLLFLAVTRSSGQEHR